MACPEITGGLTLALVAQVHAEEAAMDRQPATRSVVIDKAQLFELIHEITNSRPGGAYNFREGLLTDLGDHPSILAVLANTGKGQEDSRQTPLAGIEKVSQEIFLDSDDTRKEVGDEELAEDRVLIDRVNDGFLFHTGNGG